LSAYEVLKTLVTVWGRLIALKLSRLTSSSIGFLDETLQINFFSAC